MNRTKRVIGTVVIAILLGLAAQGVQAEEDSWTSFVVHVRQGAVTGPVVGGGCKGASEEGAVRTVGCARRTASAEGAWLDGECWITIRDWTGPLDRDTILKNWGHEFGHCVEGFWHE